MTDLLDSLPISRIRIVKWDDAPLAALLAVTLPDSDAAIGIKALWPGLAGDVADGILILSGNATGAFYPGNEISDISAVDLREIVEIRALSPKAAKTHCDLVQPGNLVCHPSYPERICTLGEIASLYEPMHPRRQRKFICVGGNESASIGRCDEVANRAPYLIKIAERPIVTPLKATK